MANQKRGKVYIVGGGPGDFLLLTLKAVRVLKEADIIVYDHLVPDIAIDFFSSCQKIYAGKESSKHTMTQDQINDLLVKYASEGKKVVRLKGGDPFIFGRGGEECEYLYNNNIDFEVIPGISSFYSALAYAGVPITHRNYVSSFAVATGSEAEKEKTNLDFSALSRCGTLVFLMTVKALPKIVEELKKYLDPKTPCILVQNGTVSEQKSVLGTLEDILKKAEGVITPPAIFAVGQVSLLHQTLNWFEKKILFGKKIVITRPIEQSYDFAVMISENGGEPILFPSLKITKNSNHSDNIKSFCKLIQGFDESQRNNSLVVFTSQNGVEIFFNEIFSLGLDSRILYGFKISAVGEKTAKSLQSFGIRADLVPKDFSTSSLAKDILNMDVKNVFFLRAEDVRNIEKQIQEAGKSVMNFDIYKIEKYEHSEEKIRMILKKNPDVLTFASSLSFEYFIDYFSLDWVRQKTIACIGRITAKTVERKIGKVPEIISEHHTIESLFQKILDYFCAK